MGDEWKPSGRFSGLKAALIRGHFGFLPERPPMRPADEAGSPLRVGATNVGTLELVRGRGLRNDPFRSYQVFIDGWEVGAIRVGETHSYSIVEGRHEFQLLIDWAGSPPITFEVRPTQIVRVRCWRNIGFLRIALQSGLGSFGDATNWIGVEIVDAT